MNNAKVILILIFSFLYLSCDSILNDEPNDSTNAKIYVALQGMGDKVAVLRSDNLQLIEMIEVNFSSQQNVMEMPHYISIDPAENIWFLTTMGSSSVGMFSTASNTLIDYITLDFAPALLEIDTNSKLLYVSRMTNTDLFGTGMSMGSSSSLIDVISYSSDGMSLQRTYDTQLPSPHAISIDPQNNKLITASLTYDFLTKINLDSQIVQNISLDSNINPEPVLEMNRLKPLEIIQVEDFSFITCLGGEWGSEVINGQVQMWDSNSLNKVSEYHFKADSNPWHLIDDPSENAIYVVLSGYLSGENGESGVVKLKYTDNSLQLDWENLSSDFKLFHGVDISDDGAHLFVSSRNGEIFKFDTRNGALLNVNDLSSSLTPYPAPGGLKYLN